MATLVDSYSEVNSNNEANGIGGATFTYTAQSFTGIGLPIAQAKFYIKKVGTPTGNVTVDIFAHSGTYGTSSVATGAALATSDGVDVTTISTTISLVTFTFSGANQIDLANGTNYVAALHFTGGDGSSNKVNYGQDTTSPTHGGNRVDWNGSVWSAVSGADLCFYIYSNDITPALAWLSA